MLDVAGIFQNRKANETRLLAYGFESIKQGYRCLQPILDGQFQMEIRVTGDNSVSVQVWDKETGEAYILIHTPGAVGAFVTSVAGACETELKRIAETCFDWEVFSSSQAKKIIEYVEQTYQDRLEFLWKKFPSNAVFRRQDNRKWYGAILTVAREKLGLAGSGNLEVLDLRGDPADIQNWIQEKRYLPGYHMNKKHWFTICLDETVPMKEILERLDQSYLLARK